MRVGVVNEETWSFFREIYEELQLHHTTTLFKRRTVSAPLFNKRINASLFQRDLGSLLRTNDVVFFEWASELLAHGSRFPKTCAIVTRLHRYEMYYWADQIQWNAVDRIILVSQAKKDEFIRRFPDQAGKIEIIPEAVSLNDFQPREKSFNGDLGILCHLTPRKRVYELILAFYELCKIRDGFTLHIGGGKHPRFGDYFEALHKLVNDLGLSNKVIFYGNVTDPQDWYTKIDIFISNSYSEGLQVSPMEASASGCFCLSHRWDGAQELFPQEMLYYTEKELIQRILEYTDASLEQKNVDVEKLQGIIRECFSMDKTKRQIRQVIENAAISRAEGLNKRP
jgi:glycosyltransferase involved in cell wall biosynthesis